MTCLDFDKAKYSLRAKNEEIKTTTHATRRRDMIVSQPGFLAQHHDQAPCAADRKVASAAADRAARDSVLAAKQARPLMLQTFKREPESKRFGSRFVV